MTLEKILETVSEVTGVSIEEIKGGTKSSHAAIARNVFYQIGKDRGFRIGDIALMANKSHATVSVANIRDEKLMKQVSDILFPKKERESPEIKSPGIVDISSRYFGECFMIMRDEEVLGWEKSYKKAFERIENREKIVALYEDGYFRSINTKNFIIGKGNNVEEAMIDFLNSLEEMKESFEVVPMELTLGVKFKY